MQGVRRSDQRNSVGVTSRSILADLTPPKRARRVRGRSNRELADELSIGQATVKSHMANLLTKPECRDRAQLAVIAYESGLVRLGGRRHGAPTGDQPVS